VTIRFLCLPAPDHCHSFPLQKIDGVKLLALTYEDCQELTEVDGVRKVGPAVKLQALIDSLKKRK
jgi:hypothetical protein